MSKVTKALGYFFVLAIIGFGGWLFWVFITSISAADDSIKAGLIGLFGALSAAIFAHYQTKKREIESRHFVHKREGYMHMIDLLFDSILSIKNDKEMDDKIMTDKMMSFKKALIVWGSPEIIDIWNQFEINSQGIASEKMVEELEKVLRAIRKDLGHDDSQLGFGNLWGLMLVPEDKKILLEQKPENKGKRHD